MTTEEFVEKLRRPLFVYTKAMHIPSTNMPLNVRAGAVKRKKNALAEIHQLILEYCHSGGAPSQHLKKNA